MLAPQHCVAVGLRRRPRRGEDAHLAATVTRRTGGLEQRREVDLVEAADLREEVGATDELVRARDAEVPRDARELVLHRGEEAHELLHGALELLRLEALEPALRRLDGGLDLRRDADV